METSLANQSQGKNRVLQGFASSEKRLCITVPEAAAMLGISRNFAYQLVKEHMLPVRKFGKRLLIPRVALEKMLEKGEGE